jgi:nucleoside-diphosphate-sugar epimerase
VSRRPPLSSPVEVAYASSHLYVDSSRARTELGWSPSPIEPSLRRAIEWFRANGYA